MQAKHTIRNLMRGRFSEVTGDNLRHTARHVPMLFRQAWRYYVQRRAYAPPEVRIFLRVHCEQEPTSRSSITLTDQRDPLGLLRVRFDWQISERELDTIRQYVLIAQRSLAGIARIIPDPDLMSGSPNSSPAATTATTTWAACACPPPTPPASSTPTFASTASPTPTSAAAPSSPAPASPTRPTPSSPSPSA